MRFIPKQTLTEAEANPLDINNPDLSNDEAYKQAILGAISSESKAYTEYDQILSLEDKVTTRSLVDLFHDTLIDLRDEEMKHLAQLTEKLSDVPEMKTAYELGKKEAETGKEQSVSDEKNEDTENNTEKEEVKESTKILTEAVEKNRTYDAYSVGQIIADELNLNDRQYEIIENLFYEDELTAEQVDKILAKIRTIFTISDDKLDRIENTIIASNNPIADRINDFKGDIDSDISSIENVMENVYSIAAKEKLYSVIQYLKGLEYNGEKEIGWSQRHSMFGGNNPKKRIIA